MQISFVMLPFFRPNFRRAKVSEGGKLPQGALPSPGPLWKEAKWSGLCTLFFHLLFGGSFKIMVSVLSDELK